MKYCKRCVMPDTRPHIVFNEKGVCDACLSAEKKDIQIDWVARRKELEEILDRYRSNDPLKYDCIVPVSGGKDSHFQTYMLKHEFKMNPLAVTFAQCSITEIGRYNLQALSEIGVDHIMFTPNRRVYRQLFRLGLEKVGDPCWVCHAGIFTVPMQIAVKFGIPLIVWGESGQMEYGGPARERNTLDKDWRARISLMSNTVNKVVDNAVPLSDLKPYIYPSDEEINKLSLTSIFLGYYLKWDAKKQVELMRERTGFRVNEDGPNVGTYTNYENLDGKFVGFHDYLMYLKYGFGRATSHACIDIRNKRLTRDEAIDLVNKYEGELPEKYYEEFLEFLGMTDKEFREVCDTFVNKEIFEKDKNGNWVKREAHVIKTGDATHSV